ncbi:MAG: hypothetical protein CMF52_06580 [Legionellales bacterium]|mgnify:CR=1 FL=1|nr:hypothetical protein [Legionellales bacterium]|tara:strand:+ start:7240 stop:7887 length:648 start_codon:yes stop_codon:yes gene_type:complete
MSRTSGLAAKLLAEQYKKILQDKGFAFFENGDYNLNIIGVRNASGDASKFDDFISVLYKISGEWTCDTYPVTTEPGTSILKRPLKEVEHKGTAILVPSQYRGVYKIGWHGSRDRGHMALCQRGGQVKVWRDNNRDIKPDYHGQEDVGWYGINIHKHRGSTARINTGGASAGCQVFQSSVDFSEFMETCSDARDKWGNSFTYTLLEEKDLTNKGVC